MIKILQYNIGTVEDISMVYKFDNFVGIVPHHNASDIGYGDGYYCGNAMGCGRGGSADGGSVDGGSVDDSVYFVPNCDGNGYSLELQLDK